MILSRTTGVLSQAAALLSTLSFFTQPAVAIDEYSQLRRCPLSCQETNSAYHSVDRVAACNETMLLDFNVHNLLDDPDTHASIVACTARASNASITGPATAQSCGSLNVQPIRANFRMQRSGSSRPDSTQSFLAAAQAIQTGLKNDASCNDTLSFAFSNGVSFGLYSGPMVQNQALPEGVLQHFIDEVQSNGLSELVQVEYCEEQAGDSGFTVGFIASTDASLVTTQKAVAAWSAGNCSGTSNVASQWQSIDLPVWASSDTTSNNTTSSNSTVSLTSRSRFHRRGDCTTQTVVSGDSCGALASRCGISGADFTKYNSNPNLCSTLQPGQRVCCSAGTLPDLSPKPQADGTCATHTVVSGDTCGAIAQANSITADAIGTWNKKTWQFMGCTDLQIGQVICISSGDPPMPGSVPNALCGPQVPGTEKPANISQAGALASLNPCPLNACCDIFGQCGTTPEFCTESKSDTGAPGTAAKGENGCISNCGTDIIQSSAPGKIMAIGYYEGFSVDRPCLNMEPLQIPDDKFTHIHFAFGNISESFEVSLSGSVAAQFNTFYHSSLSAKKILSFGGWSFSTESDSFAIFRKVVTDSNRKTFIDSLVTHIKDWNIDGLDFDWEYPGAPDIFGIPPGDKGDGGRYLQFLKDLRAALPSEKTISIAAPASYWYLKGFPIKEIGEVVDYIVYMTYDLHGQWDYGNTFSDEGCKAGNCLRSQVNLTETNTALSMITKAGVPSNKIAVGITSYGRSFKMTDTSCTGPMCTYVGPESGANPGVCTGTAGYISNAEIYDLLGGDNPTGTTYYDQNSNSDIAIINGDWISFQSDNTKKSRTDYYIGMNFLGTSDWAIDLAAFAADISDGDDGDGSDISFPDCFDVDKYNTVDDVINDHSIPDLCVNTYLIGAMAKTMTDSLSQYNEIMNDGYKDKYNAFVKQIHHVAPDVWQKFYANDIDDYFTCDWLVETQNDNTPQNVTGAGCPPNKAPAGYLGGLYDVTFVVKDQDAFCNKIGDDYGLSCDWLETTTTRIKAQNLCGIGPNGQPSPCEVYNSITAPNIKGSFDVPDPSNLITQSLGNYSMLADWLGDSAYVASAALFGANDADAVDASGTAVFTTLSAVTSMQKVADAGEKAEQEEREAIILAFLSALFLIIPGLGEAIDAVVDIAAIARIATLIGEAGNIALTSYDIAKDPKSAPMAIIGGLLGGVIGREDRVFAEAAAIFRGTSKDALKGLGDDVVTNLGKVSGSRKSCSL